MLRSFLILMGALYAITLLIVSSTTTQARSSTAQPIYVATMVETTEQPSLGSTPHRHRVWLYQPQSNYRRQLFNLEGWNPRYLWTDDGEWLWYVHNIRNIGNVWRLHWSGDNNQETEIWSTRILNRIAWSEDGESAAFVSLSEGGLTSLYRINADSSGMIEHRLETPPPAFTVFLEISTNQQWAYVYGNPTEELTHVFRIRMDGTDEKEILTTRGDVLAFDAAPTNERIAIALGYWDGDGPSSFRHEIIHIASMVNASIQMVEADPGKSILDVWWTDDGQLMGLIQINGLEVQTELVHIHLDTQTLEVVDTFQPRNEVAWSGDQSHFTIIYRRDECEQFCQRLGIWHNSGEQVAQIELNSQCLSATPIETLWTANDENVLFHHIMGENCAIYRYNLADQKTSLVLEVPRTAFIQMQPTLNPNWIILNRRDVGTDALSSYLVDVHTGKTTLMPNGQLVAWSPIPLQSQGVGLSIWLFTSIFGLGTVWMIRKRVNAA